MQQKTAYKTAKENLLDNLILVQYFNWTRELGFCFRFRTGQQIQDVTVTTTAEKYYPSDIGLINSNVHYEWS